MAGHKPRTNVPSFDDRFTFLGDAVAPGSRAALKPALFEVEDRDTGAARSLKLWRKTGTPVDADLRGLWRHEMRQVQRVMSYAGARDVIVDILEFVEDAEFFGVLLERAGQPLSAKRLKVNRHHWLHDLAAARGRTLLWKNIRRVATALGIVHAQGLVHGKLSADVVMTEGVEEPDFQLGGFEWSLWLGADNADRSHAKLGAEGAAQLAGTYSFAEDWRALGHMIADCLGVKIKPSGEFVKAGALNVPFVLNASERALLKRLAVPTRFDLLDAPAVARSIDEIVASIAQAAAVQSGTFILCIPASQGLGEAVYEATNGEIPVDEFREQLDWIRADLDTGPKLLVPRPFDPATGSLRLITDAMVYRLRALRDEGSAVWNIGFCNELKPRGDAIRLGGDADHAIEQPIAVTRFPGEAQEMRARLGPDVLDWSLFAGSGIDPGPSSRVDTIRQALLLVQVAEAVIKALECYPIEILETGRHGGQRFVTIRAEPDNDRDRFAKQVGMSESATALKRLFEEDRRDAEGKWRISLSSSLGSSRSSDVTATFVDLRDHSGRHGYQFEIDAELPPKGSFFLKAERDTGTERVIGRRLRNIKALDTRVDLADMLDDPWRARRTGRETISEADQSDAAFLDLDQPKQRALMALWSVLPSYFVVGPPGVGKTKLATETIRRRFQTDRAARLLVSAQGHDALDHLQSKITETLHDGGMDDVIVVRTTTPDRRPTSDEEAHLIGLGYLQALSDSDVCKHAPQAIRDRIKALKAVAESLKTTKNAGGREERSGLHAISSLVVDGANIVISTANFPDIETLVEAREQFDWVIIEEAAKATGPELVGPLMLSGRRLLIGDHRQLPPFESDRLGKILRDFSLLTSALALAPQLVGPLMREGELDELERIARDPARLRETGNLALRLLEPFRTFVEDDERRLLANASHRTISTMLTEQRRMDPAIARIISEAFYKEKLKTQATRAQTAETGAPPFVHLAPMPASPVVVVNFKHVSASGKRHSIEQGRPRWHNPSEVAAVIDVLRRVRPRSGARPSLAILSPYKAQVDLLDRRIAALRDTELAHLGLFDAVRSGGGFVGTVDSFQGSEADLVIVSLVRNNPRAGGAALGFLRDRRRINVALSRAKWQLVLVGSLDFLQEAVRSVNPDDEPHDLSFLTQIVETIGTLAGETRGKDKLPLATIIPPGTLGASMSVLIAIPVFRISCRVGIDKGRGWSVMEEIILWSMTRQSKTIDALVAETGLPRQIIFAAIARFMRFRLVEVNVTGDGATFGASVYGFRAISSGHPLPVFPKRYTKHVGFVIECVSGEFYPSRDVTIMTPYKLDLERANGAEVRTVGVEGGGPSMSHEANLRRLSDVAATGWNEEIALIDGRTVDLRDDEFMVVRVVDGIPRGLPETAGPSLRHVIADAAALPAGTGDMRVGYAGPRDDIDANSILRPCVFNPADLVIGGSEQRMLFLDLLAKAQRRMIIHSTFLDARRFAALMDPIRAACQSGVTIDLLWGAERDEETEQRSAKAAAEIARMVREDPGIRGRFRVHMRTTGSHAKIVFLDTEEGWLAALGSCNWLSSPFQSVELSVVLRDNAVLADLAGALQRLVGRRGLADSIATEMALTARDLRRMPSAGGPALMGVIVGEVHDEMIRAASGSATGLFFIGCHRLGSTARPCAVLPSEVAASRSGVTATILYTQPSGPLKNRHARVLREEAAANGVNLAKTGKTPLHGKIVAWGEDDVIVTSLNWASAAADPDFPWADIGIHIHAPGIADATMIRLRRLFPELDKLSAKPEETTTAAVTP